MNYLKFTTKQINIIAIFEKALKKSIVIFYGLLT
jgi:hypothetical protein